MTKLISLKRAKSKAGTVSTLMTRPAITVRPDLRLETLQQLFLERGLSRVPVVDESGRAIGVVAKTDLIRHQVDEGDTHEEVRDFNGHVHNEPRTVDDVMTRSVVTVPAEAPLWVAAELMSAQALHGLPVVNHDDVVIGVISSLDFVRYVARQRGQ
jgi:CBS domain-containing protein